MDAVDALRIPEWADSVPIFEDYAGRGEFGGVGNREGGAGKPQPRGDLGCAAVKAEAGPPAWFAHDLELQPAHSEADAGSQSLGAGLLGGKPGGKALGEFRLRRQ